jgi:hypothetical protein
MRSHIVLGFKLTCHHHHYHHLHQGKYIHRFIFYLSFSKDDHARIRLANSADGDYINASAIVRIYYFAKKKEEI